MGTAVECLTKILARVLQETTFDLLADKVFTAKQRRIMWTTYNNLRMWFANWEHDLVELGFAYRKDNNKVIIV